MIFLASFNFYTIVCATRPIQTTIFFAKMFRGIFVFEVSHFTEIDAINTLVLILQYE